MSVGFVYPGQGTRVGPIAQDLPDVPAVHQTLSEADSLIPGGLDSLDKSPAGSDTVSAQLGLLVRGVAATRALASEEALPDVVAGHSVGAFAAAVAAGALGFAAAIRAVEFRARRMAELFPSGFGMLAVTGISRSAVSEVVDCISAAGETIWLANVNTYEQMVVTGSDEALQQADVLARSSGALRTDRLQVSVASHGPILEPVSTGLRTLLATSSDQRLLADYVMISKARRARSVSDVLDDLASSVAMTVQWRDAFGVIIELGVRFVLQLPPGHTLVGLADSILAQNHNDGVEVRAMSQERFADCVYRILASHRSEVSATW